MIFKAIQYNKTMIAYAKLLWLGIVYLCIAIQLCKFCSAKIFNNFGHFEIRILLMYFVCIQNNCKKAHP